jgi:ParB family transcriptional regulator, chromosome partitioning protein
VAEIALIENMQRKDLTPWEEADGLRALCERFGYTHEEVARKVGKSRSTVTEALSLATIPEDIRDRCRRADIGAKTLLLEIVRQPDEDSMRRLTEEIASRGMTRDDARASRRLRMGGGSPGSSSAKPYTFRYVSPGKEFRLVLQFRKTEVGRHQIAAALHEAAEKVEREPD